MTIIIMSIKTRCQLIWQCHRHHRPARLDFKLRTGDDDCEDDDSNDDFEDDYYRLLPPSSSFKIQIIIRRLVMMTVRMMTTSAIIVIIIIRRLVQQVALLEIEASKVAARVEADKRNAERKVLQAEQERAEAVAARYNQSQSNIPQQFRKQQKNWIFLQKCNFSLMH